MSTKLRKRHNNPIKYNNIVGLIYGCAIGDCLGVQVEGMSEEDIIKYFPTGIKDMPRQSIRGIAAGDWTDDTDQLILLMDNLIVTNFKFDANLYARQLLNWRDHGFAELGDTAGMGIGQLTARVMSKDCFLSDPIKAANQAYYELGSDRAPNGAIMRCGIAACSANWSTIAVNQTLITHADCRCVASTWATVSICRSLCIGETPNYKHVLKLAGNFINKTNTTYLNEWNKYYSIYTGDLNNMLIDLELGDIPKQGYTLKTFGCGIYALRQILEEKNTDYRCIQLSIIKQGGDADTNAAVSGMILGAYLGYTKLPKPWLNQLIHKKWLDKKIITMLKKLKTS